MFRFVGQNRPQFRASNVEDPAQVKDLVKKLENHQSPLEDTESYVRKELARYDTLSDCDRDKNNNRYNYHMDLLKLIVTRMRHYILLIIYFVAHVRH